jgi:hypothetical protein
VIILLVFVGAAALDYGLARYQFAVARGRAHAAGRWSVLTCLASSAATLALVDQVSPWIVLPAQCAGFYAGSWAAVRWHKQSAPSS